VSEPAVNHKKNKEHRRVLLGIVGIPALIFMLSTLLYYLVESKTVELGTVNNGALIVPPLPFNELPLTTITGEKFDYSKPEPKWAFVVIGDRDCKGDCEKILYIARQSIIALAKKMNRVRLIYITIEGDISTELQQRFAREYQGIDALAVNSDSILALFKHSEFNPLQHKRFFVVDPNGWLMLLHQVDNTEQQTLTVLGKAVVKDMKRLIK
jgi:hypothetical protein